MGRPTARPQWNFAATVQGSVEPGHATQRRTEANLSEPPDHACAGHQALTPRERARLSSILARLASPYEGERAAAGLLASAFVAKRGLAWADLTATLQPTNKIPTAPKKPSPRQERRRNGSKTWRVFCQRRPVPPGQVLNHFA